MCTEFDLQCHCVKSIFFFPWTLSISCFLIDSCSIPYMATFLSNSIRVVTYNNRLFPSRCTVCIKGECVWCDVIVITESVRNTPTTDLLPASAQPSCSIDHSETDVSYHGSATEDEPSYNPPKAHVRPTHPLKSFAVPSVPAHGSAYEGVALPSTPLLSQTGTSDSSGLMMPNEATFSSSGTRFWVI